MIGNCSKPKSVEQKRNTQRLRGLSNKTEDISYSNHRVKLNHSPPSPTEHPSPALPRPLLQLCLSVQHCPQVEGHTNSPQNFLQLSTSLLE